MSRIPNPWLPLALAMSGLALAGGTFKPNPARATPPPAPQPPARGGGAGQGHGWLDKKTRADDRLRRVEDAELESSADQRVSLVLGDGAAGELAAFGALNGDFVGVAGTKVDLRVRPRAGRAALSVQLLFAGVRVATFTKRPLSVYVLAHHELPFDGTYTILVENHSGSAERIDLSTAARIPNTLEREVDVSADRPAVVRFGGMKGRMLRGAEFRSVAGESGRWFVSLTGPAGASVDLADATRRPDDGVLELTRTALDAPGSYTLLIRDLDRRATRCQVRLRFDDPPAGRATHRF